MKVERLKTILRTLSILVTVMFFAALPGWGQEHERPAGLPAALQAVMGYHPALKGKQAELNAQQYAVSSAKAGRYPSLSAQATNLSNNFNRSVLRLQQPLWAFGKIDTAIEQAKAGYATEIAGLLQVQRTLIEDTVAAYARLEGIQHKIGVADINIAEHDQLYQRIKRRQTGQLASEADVRLAYSRFLQARAQRERIRGEQQVALTELYALTQLTVAVEQPVDPALTELPPNVEVLALEKSADVNFKQKRLDAVRLDIQKEKVAALPTISALIEQEFLDSPVNGDRTKAGFVFEGNLEGLGFVSRGRVKGAAARLDAARADLRVTKNEVRRKLSTLLHSRSLQGTLRTSQSEVVAVVEQTMESFMRQYESGRKGWIDVLNTQRELTELRFQLVQIESDWLIFSLRISALTGRLDQLAGLETL